MQTSNQAEFLQNELRHVYWMGGSPCSGKSSIADALTERHDWALYRCDDAFWRHAQIVTPEMQPVFHRVMRLTPEDLWMRPVPQQTAEELEIYREEFALIVEELLSLPKTRPVLAEGAALLPELIAPLLHQPNQAIWVVPTAQFQWEHYRQREWWRDVLKDCSDPEQAFHNWMGRDAAFAQFVTDEAEAKGLRVLTVDGQCSIAENIRFVAAHLRMDRLSNPA
jgi:hypothetical protein